MLKILTYIIAPSYLAPNSKGSRGAVRNMQIDNTSIIPNTQLRRRVKICFACNLFLADNVLIFGKKTWLMGTYNKKMRALTILSAEV